MGNFKDCLQFQAMLEVNRWCVLSFLLLLCIGQYVIFHMLLETGAGSSQNPTNLLLRTKNYPTNFDVHSDTADVKTIAKEVNQKDLSVVSYNHTQASASKIAILLPYLGKSLPSWFDLFAFSAFASSSLVDWYVFITEAPDRATPSNVHLIRVSRTQMFQRLARLDQAYINRTTGREKLESFFRYIIDVHPYILVEIKPALGFLFADYVEGYSHWAYADLDLLVGNMHLQITPDQLAKYDVITLAFGDNNRLYMRGQLTIHKNTAEVRELWKGCDYLSHIGTRMEAFFEQKKPWAFQSAEGCYSKVVVDHTELSVLYVPVQFSDAFAAPMNQKDTILLGSSLLRCYGAELSNLVMQKASQQQTIRVEQFSSEGLEKVLLGRITNSPHCSYWIDPLYQVNVPNANECTVFSEVLFTLTLSWFSLAQVCTEYVPANATISIEKGLMTYTQGSLIVILLVCFDSFNVTHFQHVKRCRKQIYP